MQIISSCPKGSAVTIGKFNGVHSAHAMLIKQLVNYATNNGLKSIVATFDKNPKHILNPDNISEEILNIKQKYEILESLDVDYLKIYCFDNSFQNLSAGDFLDNLKKELNPKYILVGRDFYFGKNKEGDIELLKSWGKQNNVIIEIFDTQTLSGQKISSSAIEDALLKGDAEKANLMLGRSHALRGCVVHGKHMGRKLGFPTANLQKDFEGLSPEAGVYAGYLVLEGKSLPCAISVGYNLTFDAIEPTVEGHVLGIENPEEFNIYGKLIDIVFIKKIRGMIKFASIEKLIEQMRQDITEVGKILEI